MPLAAPLANLSVYYAARPLRLPVNEATMPNIQPNASAAREQWSELESSSKCSQRHQESNYTDPPLHLRIQPATLLSLPENTF